MIEALELPAHEALLSGNVPGILVAFHENERPLAGLAGLLDWKFRGALSRWIRSGAIRGSEGECVYAPILEHGRVYHLLLVGAGSSENPGKRAPLGSDAAKAAQRALTGLKLPRLAVSRADLGGVDEGWISKHLAGKETLCVTA